MASAELVQLMDQDIPEGRRHLQESYNNLEKVAMYCQENYLQAKDKRHALEETKSFTTQSLASVAYQINTLATNFLHMLDLQQTQLGEMESSINHLSQVVAIHKEKVARREIGVITTNKTIMRPPGMKSLGIIFPEAPERPIKYVRKSIDYSQLDTVGHGVTIQAATPQNPRQSIQVNRHERRSSSISSSSSVSSGQSSQRQSQVPPQQPPSQRPPTPPQNQPRLGGSLGRTSGHYRALGPPVAPPSVPSHYAPNYPMAPMQNQMPPPQQYQQPPPQYAPSNQQRERKGSGAGYASLSQLPPMGPSMMPPSGPPMVPPPAPPQVAPPMGVAQPISQAHPQTTLIQSPPSQQMVPPVMHMQVRHSQLQQQHQQMSQASTMSTDSYIDALPPPPSDLDMHQPGNASPPLPPPPAQSGIPERHMAPPPRTGMMPPPYSMQMQMQAVEQGTMFSMPMTRNHAPPQHYMPNYDHYTEDHEQQLEEHGPPAEPGEEWFPNNYIEKVVAIYDYIKDKDDELSFSENAIIYVLKKNDDGWWEGVMDGHTGLFPGNYVEPLI